MKETISVIERTLEKEKKDFIRLCGLGEAISVVFLTLFLMGGIALIFILIMSATGVADAGDKYTSPEGLLSSFNAVLVIVTTLIAVNFSANIFKSLKDGETPFRYDIADKIKGAGIALAVGGVICSTVEFIRTVLVDTGVFSEISPFGSLDVSEYCFFGLFLIALSYIFNYGCKLQQESDETI